MTYRFGVPALVVAALLTGSTLAIAAPPAAPPTGGHPAPPAHGAPPASSPASSAPADSGAGTALSQDAAARSRMHECGHQWSTMKKAGLIGTLTWKEFSATCLVVSK